MKRITFPCFLLSLSLLSAHDDWSLNNHWSATAEYVYMKRRELRGKNLVDDANKPQRCTCSTLSVMSSQQLLHDFSFEEGYRLGAGYHPDQKSTWEASFLYLQEWRGERKVKGNRSLSFPFDNPDYTDDFNNADEAHGKYHSRFYSIEGNYWRHVTARRVDYFSVSWILGLRYIPLKEHFNLAFIQGSDKSDYSIHTKNRLYGAQAGGNLQINPDEHWSWDITVKVGAMLNNGSQHTFLGDQNNTVVLRHTSASQYCGTFLADAAAQVAYQWNAHWDIHAGYQMIYLSGLALAPEQIDKESDAASGKKLNVHGQVLVHGLFVGLTYSF